MTVMRHGDYVARITYDEEIDSFFGEVINTSDVITFCGQSIQELRGRDGQLDRGASRSLSDQGRRAEPAL
jgi:predicted HicB family RNase H-like nuclease